MSQRKPKPFLNSNDLSTQIRRMVAFIEHEATERAEEIDSKSDGEFCFEKGRLIHNARKELQRIYEKKEKLVVKQALIDAATMQNQARLRELGCRDAHIARVEAEVQERLVQRMEDKELYSRIILDLIVQGLFRLLEKKVSVRVMEQDKSLVEGLLESASKRYQEGVGHQVQLSMDTSRWLPPSCLGGVELANANRRVRVINTFHRRLQMVVRHLVPTIREYMFNE